MQRIPHRYPFVWIDTIAIEPASDSAASTARASVRLTGTTSPLRGGTLPGALALEVMAQAALGIVGEQQTAAGEVRNGYLAGMDRVTFLPALLARPLLAGDVLEIEVERTASFGALVKIRGVALRDGEPLVEGELILAAS